jgi:hypothetical protein
VGRPATTFRPYPPLYLRFYHPTRAARTRGLCHACYVAALRLVRTGLATWRQLEEAGRARPRKATPFNRHPADRR